LTKTSLFLLTLLSPLVDDTPRALTDTRSAVMGGVSRGQASSELLSLSLAEAIERGLQSNLGLILSGQDVQAARGSRWEALADLLPDLKAHLTATRQKINLEAFGFTGFPGIPTVVGPFNVVDVRAVATQNLVDFEAIYKTKARTQSLAAARHSYQDTRDLVVLVCGSLYLAAVAEDTRIVAARAQLETARALHQLAVDRKQAGLSPGVDVLRADVEEQSRHQQFIVAENRAARAKLALARAIGLPLGQRFRLTGPMPHPRPPDLELEEALRVAYANRSDWKSAQARVRAAEAGRSSALGQALPKLDVSGDYGAIGQSLSSARRTYSFGAAVRVPLFEGGRAIGKVIQADAVLESERAMLADLQGRIDFEVRTALLDLAAGVERVAVAERALALGEEQLRQAQDRFEAGVANNIDVVQAQEVLAEATENQISAIYDENVARASLARAVGSGEAEFRKGARER